MIMLLSRSIRRFRRRRGTARKLAVAPDFPLPIDRVGYASQCAQLCQSLGINPRKENLTPIGRPIRIVDGGAPVRELFA